MVVVCGLWFVWVVVVVGLMISLTTAGWRGRASAKGELSVLLYAVLFLGRMGPFFFTRVTFWGGRVGVSDVYWNFSSVFVTKMHR